MSEGFALAPESPIGSPAPFWFILIFKTFGFVLHMIPMHLWLIGMLLIVVLSLMNIPNGRRLVKRLMPAMPILIALGINFGIIPLLFMQVAYYPVAYPAGILMAWPWLSVIAFLMVAYYGTYFYAIQVRKGKENKLGLAAAALSSALFIIIGFLFASNLSLMVNSSQMLYLYERTSIGPAVTGLGLNLKDPTLFARWLLMFGLAIMTTAVYVFVDAVSFASKETENYRNWARRLSFWMYSFGFLWFAIIGSWYIFGTLPKEVLVSVNEDPVLKSLFVLTAISPGPAWACLLIFLRRKVKYMSAVLAFFHLIVLASNAASRQWVQNLELEPFFDPASLSVKMQLSPLIIFLVLFMAGIALIVWMVNQLMVARKAGPRSHA